MTDNYQKVLYSAKTLNGNWYNRRCVEELEIQDLIEKCSRQDLIVQKNARRYKLLLDDMPTTLSRDGLLNYGDNVCLVNPGGPSLVNLYSLEQVNDCGCTKQALSTLTGCESKEAKKSLQQEDCGCFDKNLMHKPRATIRGPTVLSIGNSDGDLTAMISDQPVTSSLLSGQVFLTAAPYLGHGTVRSVFSIVRASNRRDDGGCGVVKNTRCGNNASASCTRQNNQGGVCYGDHVQLRLASPDLMPFSSSASDSHSIADCALYVVAGPTHQLAVPSGSELTAPRMSGNRLICLKAETVSQSAKNYETHWRIEHQDPDRRNETQGTPVPLNTKVLIVHCFTNTAMSVEEKYIVYGLFGGEYEACVKTHLDQRRVETDANHFILATQTPPR